VKELYLSAINREAAFSHETDERRGHLGPGIERLFRYPEEYFRFVIKPQGHGKRPVGLAPGHGYNPFRHLLLEKDVHVGRGKPGDVEQDLGGAVVREVRDDFREGVGKVELQEIAVNQPEACLRAEAVRENAAQARIDLNGRHAFRCRDEPLGQSPEPGAYFKDPVVGRDTDHVDHFIPHVPGYKKILAQPLVGAEAVSADYFLCFS